MVIPIVKLGTLALRSISKPIANKLKQGAGLHPTFRDLIINLAQANHRFSTTMQRRIYGRSTDILIRPLNEERAVQAAATLLGELFIFTVAGAAIIYEVQRSAKAEARKEQQRRQEIEALAQKNRYLEKELEHLTQKLQQIEAMYQRRSLKDYFNYRPWSAKTI
ncbi:hypothetical protein like AT1G28510 [Hibiscus trionum]|uniref:OPA3-like protein n=1 Tax=Hibiscus trionum TaxID=183268 RepID=A0A9W7MSR5_HIBTR|nr:hypothetical protein like AT1G28510 [Hibiscus trionum]